MRTPHIVVPLLALIVLGIAPASAQNESPGRVDTARGNGRYVIEPGAEPLFADMLGRGETLPGGCKLTDGKIDRSSVLATYACGDAEIALELVHPESAKSGAVRTQRFAVGSQERDAPAGLVDSVARAHSRARSRIRMEGPRPPANRASAGGGRPRRGCRGRHPVVSASAPPTNELAGQGGRSPLYYLRYRSGCVLTILPGAIDRVVEEVHRNERDIADWPRRNVTGGVPLGMRRTCAGD